MTFTLLLYSITAIKSHAKKLLKITFTACDIRQSTLVMTIFTTILQCETYKISH